MERRAPPQEEDAPDPLEPAAPPSPSRTPPASPHKPCTQRSPARRESQESSAAAVPATVPEGPSEEAAEVERVGSGVGTEGENEDERDANSDSLGTCAVAGAEGAGKEAAADRLRSLSEPVVGALRTPGTSARSAHHGFFAAKSFWFQNLVECIPFYECQEPPRTSLYDMRSQPLHTIISE